MNRLRTILIDQSFCSKDNVVAKLLGEFPSKGDTNVLVDEFWNRQLYSSIFTVPVEYYV